MRHVLSIDALSVKITWIILRKLSGGYKILAQLSVYVYKQVVYMIMGIEFQNVLEYVNNHYINY